MKKVIMALALLLAGCDDEALNTEVRLPSAGPVIEYAEAVCGKFRSRLLSARANRSCMDGSGDEIMCDDPGIRITLQCYNGYSVSYRVRVQ
jgi:hypothetical protein